MTLSYDSTRDDFVEVAVRRYLRGKAAASGRLRGALMWAVVFGLLALIGFHSTPGVNLPAVSLAAAAWGAGLVFLTYKGSVRRRITRYVATEYPGDWPRPASAKISEGHLRASAAGATSTHAISDLVSVSDDGKYLELVFGSGELCAIPLRAFEDSDHKAAFLAALGHSPVA